MVTQSNIDVGSLVTPGQPLGTISNRINYELEAGVPLTAIQQLNLGDQITFTSNKVKGSWVGRVIRINNQVDPATQNIPVFFSLMGSNLRSGMYLEGLVETTILENVSVIPSKAIGRDESVLLLKNNVITRKQVETIEYLLDSVIISGLEESDQIILNRFDQPVEGLKVER